MTKEQLRKYRQMAIEKVQLEKMINSLELKIRSPRTSFIDGMPHVRHNIGVEELIVKYDSLIQQYKKKTEKLIEEQIVIEKIIEKLDGRERILIRYYYLDGMKWEDVCKKMNYSWAQIHRIHAIALQKLK